MSLFLKKRSLFVFAIGCVAHAASNPVAPVRTAKQLYADIKKVTTDGHSKDFSDLPKGIQNERKKIIVGSILTGITVLTTPTIPMEMLEGFHPTPPNGPNPIEVIIAASVFCHLVQEAHKKIFNYVGITSSLQLKALSGATIGALLALKYINYSRRSIASFKSLNRKGLDLLIAHKHDLKKFKEQFEALVKKDEAYSKREAFWALEDLSWTLYSFLKQVEISKDGKKVETELKELLTAIDETIDLFKQDIVWQKEMKARTIGWIKNHQFVEDNLLW